MKPKKAGGTLLVLSLVLGLGYWAGYQHGHNSNSLRPRLNNVSNLKHIGLAFRVWRNDIARFAITGETAAAQSAAPADARREGR